MAKAVVAWAGGIQSLVQFAATATGKLYRRVQNKTNYGYQWSPWKEFGQVDIENPPMQLAAGFSTCYRAGRYTAWENWRLPS